MSKDLLTKCLDKGIRMTNQRQVIVSVIGDADDHPDVDELTVALLRGQHDFNCDRLSDRQTS